MIEVSRLLLMLLIELLILSTACAAIVTYLYLSKRRRERAALKNLIATIRQDSGRREDETRQILQKRFGLSDKPLEEAVAKISREEKQFYQTVIDLFLRRDTAALQNFSVDYEKSVEPYRTLAITLSREPVAAEPADAVANDLSDELLLLREENQRLSDELQLTMNTMGTMLNEYTQMFAGGSEAGIDRDKIRQLIVPGSAAEAATAGDEAAEEPAESPDPEGGADQAWAGEEAEPVRDEPPVDDAESAETAGTDERVTEDEVSAVTDDPAVTPELGPDSDAGPDGLVVNRDDEVVNLDDVLEDPDGSKDS